MAQHGAGMCPAGLAAQMAQMVLAAVTLRITLSVALVVVAAADLTLATEGLAALAGFLAAEVAEVVVRAMVLARAMVALDAPGAS